MGKKKIPEEGIYDARELGAGRMLLLGFQHMFAMFGATVLVPILTGLDVSTTLLFAGLGTLLFHLITGGKVPAFLGSSFAFLGGYATIAPMLDGNQPNLAMLPYACFGVACAGLVYAVLAALVRAFGAERILFGSDCPWGSPQNDLQHIRRLPLTDEEKAAILGGNAKRLLGI